MLNSTDVLLDKMNGLVDSFSEDSRILFENVAEGLELMLQKDPCDFQEIVNGLPEDELVRQALILHVLLCMEETEIDRDAFLQHVAPAYLEKLGLDACVQSFQPAVEPETSEFGDSKIEVNSEKPNDGSSELATPKPFQFPPNYVFKKEFARSGMGLVFLVENTTLNRREVFKTIKPQFLNDSDLVKRFQAEARKISELRDSKIVEVYAADQYCGFPYYTMEYMEGGSLADRLHDDTIDLFKRVFYIAVIARALQKIHSKGVVHRDIKPGNILFTFLDNEERVKLADFGLAKQYQYEADSRVFSQPSCELTQGMAILGTPGYIAPEQIEPSFRPLFVSDDRLAMLSDQFALGATLFQSLCGRLPYQATEDKVSLTGPIANDWLPPSHYNKDVNGELDDICQRALQKEPAKRYNSIDDIAQALEFWLWKFKPNRPERLPETGPVNSLDLPDETESTSVFPGHWAIIAAVALVCLMGFWFWPRTPRPIPALDNSPNELQAVTKPDLLVQPASNHQPPENSSLAQLCQANWQEDAAKGVVELNDNWFQTLAQNEKTKQWKDIYFEKLKNLPKDGVIFSELQRDPLLAAYCLSIPAKEVLPIINQDYSKREQILDLLLFYPEPQSGRKIVQALTQKRDVLLELQEKGWYGVDFVFLDDDRRPGTQEYVRWLTEIVENHLVREHEKTPAYVALVMTHGAYLHNRLREEESFRNRFHSEIWPKFREIANQGKIKMGALLAYPAIWNVLELPEGAEFINKAGLLPIVLFYGKHKYPASLKDKIREVLQSENGFLMKALVDPRLQDNQGFHQLLAKNLPLVPTLAVAVDRILSSKTPDQELNKILRWSEDRIVEELKAEQNASDLEKIVPQAVYLTVGIKALSGQEVYTAEWERLWYQGVHDVALVVTKGMVKGTPQNVKAFHQGFDAGYWGVVNGAEDVKTYKRKMRERELGRTADEDDRQLLNSLVQGTEDYFRAIRNVQTLAKQTGVEKHVLEITPVVKFFREQIQKQSFLDTKVPDLKTVRYWKLKNGMLSLSINPDSNFAKEYPHIAAFFEERHQKLINAAASRLTEEEQLARQQMLSAWHMLNSLGHFPSEH